MSYNPIRHIDLGRNRIINGDFAIWQRGTSFSSSGYTADRWRYDTNTDDTVSITRQSTNGSEPFDALYYARISLTAGSSGTFNAFSTRLEFPKLYFGKTVTLSFYAKADTLVSVTAEIQFVFSGVAYETVASSVSVGTSWNRYSVTFNLGTPTGYTESGADYLDVLFLLPINTTVNIDFANIQLEEGKVATDFEYVPFEVQLARCQRWYQVFSDLIISGYTSSGTQQQQSLLLPCEMRTTPSVNFSVTNQNNLGSYTVTADKRRLVLGGAPPSGTAVFSATFYVTLDAEL